MVDEVVLQAYSLSKSFGDLKAVDNVSLSIKRGQIAGLLGPNGAGKSTTLKILSTLLTPGSGRAVIAGFDTVGQPLKVRQHIGVIFQDSTLDNRLTGRENLEFHCMLYKVPKKERKARISKMLDMVDLNEAADRIAKTYSGGMKRRLEIARGLLHTPSLLFLDEPTVGLDPQTRVKIWDYIRQLVKEYGMGVLMTTHYMEEAENCDYISIMDNGCIIAEGSPSDLKATLEGHRIYLESPDVQAAIQWLETFWSIKANPEGDGLAFVLPNGETQLANLITEIPYTIQRLTIHQPTLEDVFLRLTGRKIRDLEPGSRDLLKLSAQRKGRL